MCEQLTGSEILLIVIAIMAGLVKVCLVCNESRTNEIDCCDGLIQLKRDPYDLEQLEENHDAMNNVDS